MTFNRTIFIRIVAALIVLALLVVAVRIWHAYLGPEVPSRVVPVASGDDGCQNESYHQVGSDWDLSDTSTGQRTADFGAVQLYQDGTMPDVWCAVTASGPATRGEPKYMSVRVGYYDPDDGDLVWPDTDYVKFSDSGKHMVDYAGGVVIMVPEGKCLFVRGKVRWQGHLYWRDVATEKLGCS